MTEIGMRVARALLKKNLTKSQVSIETVAKIVDDVAQISILLDTLNSMSACELINLITLARAKEYGTF